MAMTENSPVVGVFTERGQADRAVDELQNAGFTPDQIQVAEPTATDTNVDPNNASPGDERGSLLEGTKSIFSNLRSLFGGKGSDERHIVNNLVKLGVPQEDAQYYQQEFELGRTIIAVNAPDRQEDAREILSSNGGYSAATRPNTYDPNAPSTDDTPPTTLR